MAKKSERQPMRHNKYRSSGCIWGLISIFDFRQGRSTHKLISDRRCGIRHGGNGHTRDKLEKLSSLNDHFQITVDEESKTTATCDGNHCVKNLMAEEMVSDRVKINKKKNTEIDPEEYKAVTDGQVKKRQKKRKKSWSKSGNIETDDLRVPENLGSECSCNWDLSKHSIEDLSIDDMMKEVCHQIYQNGVHSEEHDQNSDAAKLGEAIKEFVYQEVIHKRECTEHGNNDQPKELVNAFQILSLDEDLFLKITQDPNSPLVKYAKKWLEIQGDKNENLDVVAASILSENDSSNLKTSEPEDISSCRHRRFSRSMVKSQEKIFASGNDDTDASKRIVILKPVSTTPQGSEIGSVSSTESHRSVQNKETNNGRVSSYMFLKKIKGKIKSAMGKEHHEVSSSRTGNSPNQHQDMADGSNTISDDCTKKSSRGKDRFLVEKIARSPTCFKRGGSNYNANVRGRNIDNEPGTAGNTSQRVSDFYVEAKMHLSGMLSKSDGDSDFSSLHIPKTLGGILSLPEFCPTSSPGRDMDHASDRATIHISNHGTAQRVDENKECHNREDEDSHPGQPSNSRSKSCESIDECDSKMQTPDSNPEITDELLCEGGVSGTSPIKNQVYYEGAMDVFSCQEDGFLEPCREPRQSSPSLTGDGQTLISAEVSSEKEPVILSLDQEYDYSDQITYPESPSTSSSSPSKNADEKQIDTFTEERPSPVSVLEPSLVEDDSSPERTTSHSDVPIQPLQIHFKEYDISATDGNSCLQTSVKNKEPVFEFVNAILKASCLKWDNPYVIPLSTNHLLDPSLSYGLELSNQLPYDQKLVFDATNEVLINVLQFYLGCTPWASFVKPGIRPVPNMKSAITEVSEGVYWHLLELPLPRSLDQIVRKDVARSESWMDLRFDAECIGVGVGEIILEDLVEDTIFCCLSKYQQWEDLALPVELTVEEDSNCER